MKDLLEDLENFGIDVIMHGRKGLRATLLRMVLRTLSWVYGAAVSLRLYLYKERYIHDHHLGVPVISIGNLTVGGTGKTPVVELLAKALRDRGRRPAILSRGYKSKRQEKLSAWSKLAASVGLREKPQKPTPRLVSDFEGLRIRDSYLAGDEPLMLAMNCPGVPVVVDRDRVNGGAFAIRELGADVLLLDDGLQYLKLKHRHDIVLVDRTAPWGTGAMLPRGTLREPPKNLRRATYIFLTKSDGDSGDLIADLRRHNPVADIIECRHRPLHLQNIHTGERLPLDVLQDAYVGALSGIAVPQSFENGLRRLGARVDVYQRFTDHHRFTEREIIQFVERCVRRDTHFIVTTEKDFVRLPELPPTDIPFCFLRVEIEIVRGQEHFEKMVRLIAEPRRFVEI
ncbi:MAG: tetraacyldisaccharide 4'-kinase [Verrucomicrobiales bacterium]|nr:tetraacyldisaccharide 4'-kinase [Verrucomicrobiales bacterium]